MSDQVDQQGKLAEYGERMIEVRVRLWTNEIAEGGEGSILPKHAWDAGVVMLQHNESHGISAMNPLPFRSMADLPGKIEEVFLKGGVKLHLSKRQRGYIEVE